MKLLQKMLSQITDKNITSVVRDYLIPGGIRLHTETLCCNNRNNKHRALFLHGGGASGNHSIVRRPAMWLITNGFFDEVILPDRRGAGSSSPFTELTTTDELARDMKLLLDEMKIAEPISVIASSYGGPIALTHASIDKRVEKVILLASGPLLTITKGSLSLPFRLGILIPAIKFIIWLFAGRAHYEGYVDLDFVYSIRTIPGYIWAQIRILRKMKRSMIKSMFLQVRSVFMKENISLGENVRVNVPVRQVIGSKDTVWEKNIPVKYLKNMPLFNQTIIHGASHKDIFFRAEEFLMGAVKEEGSEE
ncbi:MAG TPA: alpha/beta hydrolase [Ignavibacteriales bacterium]|nr:alpha/beta hydrolase [Ignavibacteriales bacterium]